MQSDHAVRCAFRRRSPTVRNSAIKNHFAKCCSQLDHVCSNDKNAMNLVKMNKMTGTFCSLLECSLRTTGHVKVCCGVLWSSEWPSDVGLAIHQARRSSRSGRRYRNNFGCTESTRTGHTVHVPSDTKDSIFKMFNQHENELNRQTDS